MLRHQGPLHMTLAPADKEFKARTQSLGLLAQAKIPGAEHIHPANLQATRQDPMPLPSQPLFPCLHLRSLFWAR